MLIILEGPDGAGKSTLAAKLQDFLTRNGVPAKIRHLGPPMSPETAMDEIMAVRNSYDFETALICDRLHISGPVYGPLYRPEFDKDGYGEMGQAGWRYVDLSLHSLGANTLLLHADPEVLKARMEQRGDEYMSGRSDDIVEIVRRYITVCTESTTAHDSLVTVGFSIDDFEQCCRYIAGRSYFYGKAAKKIAEPLGRSYIGSLDPGVLVVAGHSVRRADRIKLVDAMGDHWRALGIVSPERVNIACATLRPTVLFSLGCDVYKAEKLRGPEDLAERIEGL